MEEWRDVVGYEGIYQVSDQGRIKSLDRVDHGGRNLKGKLLKPHLNKQGYAHINLCKNTVYADFRVNRLVGIAFIPNPENNPQINHRDGIKTNNAVGNLEWMTMEENMEHASKTGLMRGRPGERHHMAKLKEWQVREIRKSYIPKIMTCQMLGEKYGVSGSNISMIVSNRSWANI